MTNLALILRPDTLRDMALGWYLNRRHAGMEHESLDVEAGEPTVTNPMSDEYRLSDTHAGGWEFARPVLRSVLASPAAAIATVLGAGLFPIWPGTVGSALALPLVQLLRPLDLATKGAVYLALFLLCVWAAHSAGRQFGEPDHGAIVCDEMWGMAVVWECTTPDFSWMIASFLAFRIFDALKPWPISAIDRRMKNGLGVMLDDGLAAVCAILLVSGLRAAILSAG